MRLITKKKKKKKKKERKKEKKKRNMSYDFIFCMIPQSLIWMSAFWLNYFVGYSKFLLTCTKPQSSLPKGMGNFLNFSSELEETLMMMLITKEKYVLRFNFSIWSLKIWIWAFLLPQRRPVEPNSMWQHRHTPPLHTAYRRYGNSQTKLILNYFKRGSTLNINGYLVKIFFYIRY